MQKVMKKVNVLFVCMGNICRSPTAEGVFRHQIEAAGLEDLVFIDSAGTHAYHVGKPPDRRAQAAASKRGYDLAELRGRQIRGDDFEKFDYILAMDDDNLSILKQLCPPAYQDKLSLFLVHGERYSEREVPDPYYGGQQGFEDVLDLIEDASAGLLKHIQKPK